MSQIALYKCHRLDFTECHGSDLLTSLWCLFVFVFFVFLAHSRVFWVPAEAALAWSKALYIGKQTTWLKRGITCKASSYCTCASCLTSEIPDVVSRVYYAALARGFCCISSVDQAVFMCLLALDSFLKNLRVSCKFKLLWLMEMPMLVNLKCIKHKSGYDSLFHFSLMSLPSSFNF